MDSAAAVAHLRDKVPEFEPAYQDLLRAWQHWPGPISIHSSIGSFGQDFFAPLLKYRGEAEVLSRRLAAIEDLLEHGDDAVVDALFFGVIERVCGRLGLLEQ